MSKRAVLYARVSKDDTKQERRNLDGQIELGDEYATEKGYNVIERLTEDDKGAKGDDINLPQLNKVREMANNKEFDVLVVREIDRLSRSLAKQLIIEQEMKRQGIEIDYVLGDYPDTPEGNFMRHIRATVAEYEREKINERVIRGRYNKVKAGSVFVSGSAPFGYNLKQDERGNYYFEINEGEAKTVRQIYEWYLSGLAIRKIAQRLTENQTPSWADNRPDTRGFVGKKHKYGHWSQGSVRHILTKETYAGTWHYGKYKGRERRPLQAGEEPISVSVPAIVSRETWDAAKKLRKSRVSVRKHSESYDYLLKGLLCCDHCNYMLQINTAHVGGKVYPYYRCTATKKELVRDCTHGTNFYKACVADVVVWDWIVSLLTNPEQLENGLETFHKSKQQDVEPLQSRLDIVDELIAEDTKQLDRLIELYLSGEFDKELLVERKTRFEAKLSALRKEQTELNSMLQEQTVSREQIDAVIAFGQQIREELTTSPTQELKKFILNTIEFEGRMGEGEDKVRYVRVKCALGKNKIPLETLKKNSIPPQSAPSGKDSLPPANTPINGAWGQRGRRFSMYAASGRILSNH